MRCSAFHLSLLFLAWSALALSGCGPSVGRCVPVQGKITLGGKPLVGGTVLLIPLEGKPNSPRPEGRTDSQGLYTLKTVGKVGAPIGEYRMIVTPGGEDKTQDSQLNPQYSHPEKSDLKIQVSETAPPGAYDRDLVPFQRADRQG